MGETIYDLIAKVHATRGRAIRHLEAHSVTHVRLREDALGRFVSAEFERDAEADRLSDEAERASREAQDRFLRLMNETSPAMLNAYEGPPLIAALERAFASEPSTARKEAGGGE